MSMRCVVRFVGALGVLVSGGCSAEVGGPGWTGGGGEPDGGTEASADADVTEEDEGDLDVSLAYEGDRVLAGADVYLYGDRDGARSCMEITGAEPRSADQVDTVTSVDDLAKFPALDRGTVWTVLAVGLDDGGLPAAWGCVEQVEIPGGRSTVEVPLLDGAMSLEGRWEVTSVLQVEQGLPLGARLGLDVLGEMSDDENDPATFLLDLLQEQFLEDETLRAGLSWARASLGIDAAVNQKILDASPDVLEDALSASADLARALEHVEVQSSLAVEAPDEAGAASARHELVDLVLELDGRTTRFSVERDLGAHDAVAPGVVVTAASEERATIGLHRYAIGLGTLALFALHEVVLPEIAGAPRTLGELLSSMVDCAELGDWLAETTDVGSGDRWQRACDAGLGAIGAYLELQIAAVDQQYDHLTLQGHARPKGGLVRPTRLQDGEWDASWTGAAGTVPFAGTFEATLDGATSPDEPR